MSKTAKLPKRNWDNTIHQLIGVNEAKNLNEIYRFVFYSTKNKKFIYLDISLDEILKNNVDVTSALTLMKSSHILIARLRCTGLKDKFNNLIFEGDIVEYKISSSLTVGCITYLKESGEWNKGSCSAASYQKTTEIIGDLIQTPQLDYYAKEHISEIGINTIN